MLRKAVINFYDNIIDFSLYIKKFHKIVVILTRNKLKLKEITPIIIKLR
jgi:hypothetical protein